MRRLPEPNCPGDVREMRRPGVNLTVLCQKYRETHPDGYGYFRFSNNRNLVKRLFLAELMASLDVVEMASDRLPNTPSERSGAFLERLPGRFLKADRRAAGCRPAGRGPDRARRRTRDPFPGLWERPGVALLCRGEVCARPKVLSDEGWELLPPERYRPDDPSADVTTAPGPA